MTKAEIDMVDAIIGNPNFGTHGNYELSILRTDYEFKDEDVAILVREGFWDMRTSEFHGSVQYYYSFTDRWREVKKRGDYRAYLKWIQQEDVKAKERQELNDKMMKVTIISGTVTERLYFANICIAIASFFAALYYLIEIIKSVHSLNHPHSLLTSMLPPPLSWLALSSIALLFFVGAMLGGALLYIMQRLNKKDPNQSTT